MHYWKLHESKKRISPVPIGERAAYLPKNGFCSIEPAGAYTDGLRAAAKGIQMYVYGEPCEEKILITHEALYCNNYNEPLVVPDLKGILPEVRRLLREGRSSEACYLSILESEKYGYKGLASSDFPFDSDWRHPVCLVKLTCGEEEDTINNYLRTLDFDSGEATVYHTDSRGKHSHRAFVSEVDRVCRMRLETEETDKEYKIELLFEGSGEHVWERLEWPKGMSFERFSCNGGLVVGCMYDPEKMHGRGYGLILKAEGEKGTPEIRDDVLVLRGGEKWDIALKIVILDDFSREALADEAERFMASSVDYDTHISANRQSFSNLMGHSQLRFDVPDEDRLLAVEELIAQQHSSAVSPCLVEKLYDIGRYFFHTETGNYPPQIGQYNININLQICSGNSTGMWKDMETFFSFVESQFDDYRENARRLFGCGGILMPIHPYLSNGLLTHFSYTWPHHYWISCAAWVYNEFWNHYLVTGDKQFLREHVLPGLIEIAKFYEDYLCDLDDEGNFIFYPGMSPECTPKDGKSSSLMMNTTMDIMACAEALENLISAYDELGETPEKLFVWKNMLEHIPTLCLDDEGGLKEWSVPDATEDYNHRCVSHHYALWPAHLASWEKTPDLAKAIQISNRKRGQENDSAHGIMHRLFCAIRLRDGGDVDQNLRQVLDHGFVRRNLMTNHYPYSAFFPDITGSFPTAMQEMILYSEPGRVGILPALPEYFEAGSLTGIHLYCFAEIPNIEWNIAKKTVRFELRSLRDQTLTLSCGLGVNAIRKNGGEWQSFGGELPISLAKDETATLELARLDG